MTTPARAPRRTPRLIAIGAIATLLLLASSAAVSAQGVDSVTVEQRILMTPDLSAAEARRRAIDAALAEAVRRVAGVHVQSSALSTVSERDGAAGDGAVRGGYSSVVQLEAAARAVDYHVLDESWETRRAAGMDPQLYLRLRLTALVERETGTPDAGFRIALSLNETRFDVRGGITAESDEIIATIRSTRPAHLVLFTIADDSVQRLFPNDYVPGVRAVADAATELPDPEWRARGLRLRATLPAGRAARQELLMVVATRTAVALPPASLTLLALQRWLVQLPLGERAIAIVPYDVRRVP
ncbi:MAG: DUF4384 domain-containing protein [Gemmatimonadota bacterium]